MNKPQQTIDAQLANLFIAGTVIRMLDVDYNDGGTPTDKRLIVICNNDDDESLLLFTTSNIERENKFYDLPGIFIEANSEISFPKDTMIQLYRIYKVTKSDLRKKLTEGKIQFLHPLSQARLDLIYDELPNCPMLVRKDVKRILQYRKIT
jgi:hypothetical protein